MIFSDKVLDGTQAFVIPKGTEVIVLNNEASSITQVGGPIDLPYDVILRREHLNSTFSVHSYYWGNHFTLDFQDYYGNMISVELENVVQIQQSFITPLLGENKTSSHSLEGFFEDDIELAKIN